MRDLIAAVDVGTSTVKAALVDRHGRVVARGQAPLPTATPAPGRVEQDPEDWWAATRQALRACAADPARVAALALTGQMQDLVLHDGVRPTRPAILYADHRAAVEHADLLQRLPAEDWLRLTRNEQDASTLAAKIAWVRRHEPDVWRRTRGTLFGAHSWVAWRACGAPACDRTTASTTGLYDFDADRWATAPLDDEAAALLPPLHPTTDVLGRLRADAAADLGLEEGIGVVHTAGDAGTSAIGAGAGPVGRDYAYLGTSGWLARSTGDAPDLLGPPDPALFTLRHPLPGAALEIGPMLSVGACLDWAVGALAMSGLEELEALAAGSGPSGVLLLPYLSGERAPFKDPDARGAFVGLSRETTREDLARAVPEGLAFALRSIADAMGGMDRGDALPVTGGVARSAVCCQVLADVLGRPVRRLDGAEDVGTVGAALLAARGLGWVDHAGEEWAADRGSRDFVPSGASDAYESRYQIFRTLYPALRASFSALSRSRTEEPS